MFKCAALGLLLTTLGLPHLRAETALVDDRFLMEGNGPKPYQNCKITLTPEVTFGGDSAPILVISTSGLDKLSFDLKSAGRYSSSEIVQDNSRREFIASRDASSDEFRSTDLGRVLKSNQLFFVTSKSLNDGKYSSSRYPGFRFDDLLMKISDLCNFDADGWISDLTFRERAEQALSISRPDLALVRWALESEFGGRRNRPDDLPALTAQDRGFLKRYSIEHGLPVTSYLSARSFQLLLADGQTLSSSSGMAMAEAPPTSTSRGAVTGLEAASRRDRAISAVYMYYQLHSHRRGESLEALAHIYPRLFSNHGKATTDEEQLAALAAYYNARADVQFKVVDSSIDVSACDRDDHCLIRGKVLSRVLAPGASEYVARAARFSLIFDLNSSQVRYECAIADPAKRGESVCD